jgi:hypothetical protein
MTPKVEKRSSWSSRDMSCPSRTPLPYHAGAALHWPGEEGLVTVGMAHTACHGRYRAIEAYQMDVKKPPYGAIAYQVLVCNAHGVITEGRTRHSVNGANGDADSNTKYGSILALIGMGETPTPQLLQGILDARTYLGSGTVLKTHNDVRPDGTQCPGPALTKWIKQGYPAPEDDVAAEDVWDYRLENAATGKTNKAGTLVTRIHKRGYDLEIQVAALQATVDLIASTTSLTVEEIEAAAEAGAAKALENLTITVETDD